MWLLSVLLPVLRNYYIGAIVALQQLLLRRFILPDFPRQDGKVAFVTGGARGIGYYTAKHLAKLGMHVVIAGDNEADGSEAVKQIRQATLNDKVEFLLCDLASMKSIRDCVQNFKKKSLALHVLINNAGVMLVPESRTEDGFETHFGLNYLGHFLLTNLLLDTLRNTGTQDFNARVVTLSSATHFNGQLNFDDLQSSDCYSPHGAYAQSKLALVLFTYYLQHRLTAEGCHVTANAVDPGVVNTDLYKHVSWPGRIVMWMTGWLLLKQADEGAFTSIYASVSPDLEGTGGCYLYNGEKIKSADVTYDAEVQMKLWLESCKMAALPV
ncbi:E3 SUMO-protein ligase ZBED1 isoform X2 [Hyperolius riggenbachi]|uniref:E3 SUMO-protein ligase ZBED1 isoform X2 n=1 Tax=Hyperolius riggenbachi TaxID=752182 RepID=UPI0035A2E07E